MFDGKLLPALPVFYRGQVGGASQSFRLGAPHFLALCHTRPSYTAFVYPPVNYDHEGFVCNWKSISIPGNEFPRGSKKYKSTSQSTGIVTLNHFFSVIIHSILNGSNSDILKMAHCKPKPPMDSELKANLNKLSFPAVTHLTPEVNNMMRKATATPLSFLDEQQKRGISHREVKVRSQDGSNHEIILSILQSAKEAAKPRPCIYWIHGGGFHWGDRLHTLEFATNVVLECDAMCISVEYRLAPEYSFSVAVEDCYAGLRWTGEHAAELGIDQRKLMVGGMSAGGGLTAATLLACRDRQGPEVCAQCLICPGLDDRLDTVSSRQYVENSDFMPRSIMEGIWNSSLRIIPKQAMLLREGRTIYRVFQRRFLMLGRRRCSGTRQ